MEQKGNEMGLTTTFKHTHWETQREREKKTEAIHCVLLPPPLCACTSACVWTSHVCVPMWIAQDTYMNTKVCKHTRRCAFEYLLQSHNMLWPAATAYIPGKSPTTISESERGQQCLVHATWLRQIYLPNHIPKQSKHIQERKAETGRKSLPLKRLVVVVVGEEHCHLDWTLGSLATPTGLETLCSSCHPCDLLSSVERQRCPSKKMQQLLSQWALLCNLVKRCTQLGRNLLIKTSILVFTFEKQKSTNPYISWHFTRFNCLSDGKYSILSNNNSNNSFIALYPVTAYELTMLYNITIQTTDNYKNQCNEQVWCIHKQH